MNNSMNVFNLFGIILCSCCFSVCCLIRPVSLWAKNADDGCFARALSWIEKIEVKDPTVLKTHAATKCRFADKWIRDFADRNGSDRQRMCNDLVLIWTHKECIYFRDYVHHSAYAPAKHGPAKCISTAWTMMISGSPDNNTGACRPPALE